MIVKLKHLCSGLVTSGHWKGWPCSDWANYKKDGKWYCKDHLPIDPANKIVEKHSFRSTPDCNKTDDKYRITIDIEAIHLGRLRKFLDGLND